MHAKFEVARGSGIRDRGGVKFGLAGREPVYRSGLRKIEAEIDFCFLSDSGFNRISSTMAIEIKRLSCAQIPGVLFLGVEGSLSAQSNVVLAHTHQLVGLLLGKTDRRAASKAFRTFLDSDAGQRFRNGGDLRAAIQKGPLHELMYTYRMRFEGGSASVFLTLEGIREISQSLPNQDEALKRIHQELFSSFLNQSGIQLLQLDAATPEQCARYDAEEVIEEVFTDGCVPVQGNDSTVVVTQKMWFDTRLCSYESCAEKRVLEAQLQAKDAQLQAKDMQIAAINMVKAAEIAKERSEKELAQKEALNVKESAAKDVQIAKLQMKLELAEERAKLRTNGRLERSEGQDKVQRVMPGLVLKKMHVRDTLFAKLVSSSWSNDIASVNCFVKLSSTNGESNVAPAESAVPQLKVQYSSGIGPNERYLYPDHKHRAFGFCYKGPALTESVLQESTHIKEAYGVEVGGLHYVGLILFKRAGRQFSFAAPLPYELGLLPCTITAEIIPDCDHHISVYKISVETNDPVLEMLKRPAANKWYWHSSGNAKDN